MKSRNLRLLRLAQVQRFRCYYCKGKMTFSPRFLNSGAGPSVERLICGRNGGTYVRANTVAACRGCNSDRPMIGHLEYQELRQRLLREGWYACTFAPPRIRQGLKTKYGYPTGPMELGNYQQLCQMMD